MIQSSDETARVAELVERFVAIALAQEQAILLVSNAKYNRLYKQMKDIETKLKSFSIDQRWALRPLLNSQNLWVRYKAGNAILAIAPNIARRAIESVRDSNVYPESAEAASTLRALDEGSYVPN